jgi:hypothetical protein
VYFEWVLPTPRSYTVTSFGISSGRGPPARRSYIKAEDETPADQVSMTNSVNISATESTHPFQLAGGQELGNIVVQREVSIERTRRPILGRRREDSENIVHLTDISLTGSDYDMTEWPKSDIPLQRPLTPPTISRPQTGKTQDQNDGTWHNFSLPRRAQSVSFLDRS